MKKLMIFHHYNSSVGAGLSLLHILCNIDVSKYETIVCIPNVEGDLSKKIIQMGMKVISTDSVISYMHFSGNHTHFTSKTHINNIKAINRAKDDIRKLLLDQKPDIVAVNSMTLFWIGELAQKCGSKTICFHRETYRRGLLGIRSAYIKKCLGDYFDVVAFLSYYDLMQTPVRKAKYVRLTDKVDVPLYESLHQEECRKMEKLPLDSKLILYAGGMAKLKGPEVLVNALAKTKDNDIKIVFLQYTKQNVQGIKGKLKNLIKIILHRNFQYKIESLVHRHRLENRIIYRPATDKVERYFVACDAVVFPCHNPHQARPIYEAGIAKKPIIISDFPNYHEFVDETNGWLFTPDDSDELAKCMDAVFSENTTEKVKENYKRSLQNNNLSNMKLELEKIFKMLEETE